MIVKGRIRVKKWKVNNRKISQILARDPRIQGALMVYGNDIAKRTRKRLNGATNVPKKIVNPTYLGYHWSYKPARVASQVQLKPGAEVAVFRTKKGGAVGGVIPVVLIVADHPFSRSYEFGLDEFPQVGAMAGAITAVANSSPRRLKRRYATP